MLVLDGTCESTIWDDDPVFNVLDLCSDGCLISINPLQSFKVMYMTCNIFDGYVYSKTFPTVRSYSWTVSPNYLGTKIIY